MPSEPNAEEYEAASKWRDAVMQRLGEHSFAQGNGADSPVGRLLDALWRQHFGGGDNERYRSVEPPIPGWPRLPLDSRWVELRLADLSGVVTSPGGASRVELERLERPRSLPSLPGLLAQRKSYLVLGRPGSGKSTLSRWAARHLMSELRGRTLIPLYVPLRSYARWRRLRPDGRIYQFVWREQLRLPQRMEQHFLDFMEDVEGGDPKLRDLCRVFLDGWDEVPPELRPDLEAELEQFRWCLPALITSRPVASGTSFLPEDRYELAPLPFDSMNALMREWFGLAGKSELAKALANHLDRHIGLRDLARNPYVLTLLCAVVASGQLPETRAELYGSAVQFMAEYCRAHFTQFPFGADVMLRSEAVAFELLDREGASPFEFSDDDVNHFANDHGIVFESWQHARMIALEKAQGPTYGFLHTTLQEFLAGQELLRRSADIKFDLDVLGDDPRWLLPLALVVGREGATRPVWKALARSLTRVDRFGLMLLRVSPILAASGVTDGGEILLGRDIRPELWDLFVRSPDPKPYADALVECDVDYAIDRALTARGSAELFTRLMALFSKVEPNHARRGEFVAHVAQGLSTRKGLTEIEAPDLAQFLGFRPDESHNLASADVVYGVSDILAKLGETEDPSRRRSLRHRLAQTGASEAEAYLVEEFTNADDPSERVHILDALDQLGTLGVRNAIMAWLATEPAHQYDLVRALKVLDRLPIADGCDTLLALLDSGAGRPIRVGAAHALGGALDDGVFNRLANRAQLEHESDAEVRKAALTALARAGSVDMVGSLYNEGVEARGETSERLTASGYLAAVARAVSSAMDLSGVRQRVEACFLERLHREDLEPLEVVHASAVEDSEAVRAAIRQVLAGDGRSRELRAAACRAIRDLGDDKAVSLLQDVLKSATDSILREEAVLTLAFLDRYRVPPTGEQVESALWRYSLATGELLFMEETPQAVVVVATAWGPRFGGINSFNRDFCLAFGRVMPQTRVVCVTTGVSDEERREIAAQNVEILTVGPIDDEAAEASAEAIRETLRAHGVGGVELWFGHDFTTGQVACTLAESEGGRSVVIHHMGAGDYKAVKTGDGRIALRDEAAQRALLQRADIAMAVGPKLRDSASNLREAEDVTMLVPGLPDIQPSREGKGVFRAIAFGRLGTEDDRVKQGRLAAVAFGEFVRESSAFLTDRTPSLTLYGLSADDYDAENEELTALVNGRAGRLVNVRAAPFVEDREELFQQLRAGDVALMPSWYEGFGLVGWEAIAARVPLIVSRNSGLYQLLKEVNASGVEDVDVRGSATQTPDPEDVEGIATALKKIAMNRSARVAAQGLHEMLAERYSWEECARVALAACGVSI